MFACRCASVEVADLALCEAFHKADYPSVIMFSGVASLPSETDACQLRDGFRAYTGPSFDPPWGRDLHAGELIGGCGLASVPHNEERLACGEAFFLFFG